MRGILTKALNRIELNFRTKLIYYVSNKYKNSPTWFIDKNIISYDFIKNFELHYTEDFKNNNKALRNHHLKYINHKYAPAWKTLEFLTFGSISKIYSSLLDEDIKVRISDQYGVRNYQKFIKILSTIVYVRNCCAHSSVMFDLKLAKSISAFSEIKFNTSDRHNLDSCAKLIAFVLGKISSTRKEEMEASLIGLYESHKDNDTLKDIIENKIGYVF